MIQQNMNRWLRFLILWNYGWTPRRTTYLGSPVVQWCGSGSLVWVGEKAAMRLLTVQVLDDFNRCR